MTTWLPPFFSSHPVDPEDSVLIHFNISPPFYSNLLVIPLCIQQKIKTKSEGNLESGFWLELPLAFWLTTRNSYRVHFQEREHAVDA